MTSRQRLSGHIQVALPPAEAFGLFTPRGEQDWAHGWLPHFPAETPDDTEPGTVFQTSARGRPTVWVVTDRRPGKSIRYARFTTGDRAGTVTIELRPAGADTEVEVTYELTALADRSGGALRQFADGYPAYLQSWQEAISAWLQTRG